MLLGAPDGGLELRAEGDGSHRLRGRFPYGWLATLSDGGRRGRPRKETFASRAFAYRVEREAEEIHLLIGHDYGKPLASRSAGTLTLEDGDDALTFTAIITRAIAATSHGADALALIGAGLAIGLSPGFRIPPERTVPNAERVEEEDPSLGNAIIRTITAALLYELSVVTRPAYKEAEVEARRWEPDARAAVVESQIRRYRAMRQWRL